ncbi:carbohydrate-binding protein [Streptomyces sp. NBC_01317]|uniref:carbohydrate-binding protein n=1 Tax=Streptomyces sp. NBC_01317 TaxID=2903822 RepID=UPI002E0E0B63|nr:carbohydrate-binding protein [Streptomyces sp. NBC_01317]
MTAGNNGASTPEDDDPFGYLYEDGQAAAANQRRQGGYGYPGPAAQPGVPRTSYNQVRAVGERQYGQQSQVPQQQGYGQQQQYGQAPYAGYGQQPNGPAPAGPYGAPAAPHASESTSRVPLQRAGGRGRGPNGPNTKGLLIGAVAVVAVVVIGITAALVSSGGDEDKNNDAAPTAAPSVGESEQPSEKPSQEAGDKPKELPKQDAATLQLTPPAAVASDIPGAKGTNGAYVSLNGAGAAATWKVDVPKAGAYTLFVTYGVPGKDAKTSLFVNSDERRDINMKNFAKAPEGAWDKGWTVTYAYVDLDKGSNTFKISCEQGDQCETVLDQLELKAGQVDR